MVATEHADYAANAANSGSSTTMTGNKPSGAVENDLCVAFLFAGDSAASISAAPSGWTLLETDPGGAGSDMSAWMYWKKLGAGEGASWDWTLAATSVWHTVVVNVILANLTAPIADSNVVEENAVDNSLAITSAVLDVEGALVIACGVVDATGVARTWTNAADIEAYDAMLQQLHVGIYYLASGAVGATRVSGPLVVTGSNQYMVVFQVCIRGRVHEGPGTSLGYNNQDGYYRLLYDPGTNDAKYFYGYNVRNNSDPSIEYNFTDGTTTWSGTLGPEADGTVDISAGNTTVTYDTVTEEFTVTNWSGTFDLNP